MRGERVYSGLILAAIFASLAFRADQAIVENYVGRQIPTAMVARNLDRGSGFLRPNLDTAPFPNRFLVEPPIYAGVVAQIKADLGFGWERSGRLVSAAMTALGAWAFFVLVRRREGPVVALIALASFGIFPVTLRYGRAFQPDATMLGFVLLGVAGWDAYQAGGRWLSAWLGGTALAVGVTLKVTSAWVLIPFVLVVTRLPMAVRVALAGTMLLPALSWYGYAWAEVGSRTIDEIGSQGSMASTDNAVLWLRTLSPLGWLRFATWEAVARNLLVRSFTPVGFVLSVAGWTILRPAATSDRLWLGWGLGCGLAILALGAKWHHGYYWLVVAPVAAVGIARTLVAVGTGERWRVFGSAMLASFFMGHCGYQANSTWRTPPEWRAIRQAGARIAAVVPPDGLLIAPEAVLYYADRPGFRLEFSPDSARRAAGEWGESLPQDQAGSDPMALVDFYTRQEPGDPMARYRSSTSLLKENFVAGYVADVGITEGDERRAAWREALRLRPATTILLDEPALIVASVGPRPIRIIAPSQPPKSRP